MSHSFGTYRIIDPEEPESAVGFDQSEVARVLGEHGLTIRPPINYGSWCGRPEFLSYQDIIVAVCKKPRPGGS
jgi:hypothetical protein